MSGHFSIGALKLAGPIVLEPLQLMQEPAHARLHVGRWTARPYDFGRPARYLAPRRRAALPCCLRARALADAGEPESEAGDEGGKPEHDRKECGKLCQ